MRIFISHGTDEKKPAERAYLDQLESGLQALPGAQVFLDRTRLEQGDLWEDCLLDAISGCDAALIVLSKRALTRPWVQREATLLCFRKLREPTFQLHWVQRPDVSAGLLTESAWVRTSGLQRVQSARRGATVAQVVQAMAAIQAVPERPETQLERLQDALVAMLERVRPARLEALCERLLSAPAPWIASAGADTRCARLLASAVLRGRFAQKGRLPELAKQLLDAGMPAADMRRVIEIAAPMWVDQDVCRRLVDLSDAPQGREPFAAALNGLSGRWCATMTVRRSQLPTLARNVLFPVGGGSDNSEAELVRGIRRAYRERPGIEDDLESDEQVDEVLAQRTQPLFCVLPDKTADTLLLRALRRRFPRVTFIVHSGPMLPAQDSPVLVALRPGLNPQTEGQAFADYDAVKELL